ncbi:MAG: hypothetical protein P4L51_01895 [Puia sp.]|nr:hypothetical protein [Puia sp.]
MKGDLGIYFNWSANELEGDPRATDRYLRENKSAILRVAQELMERIHYVPTPIFRGIILRQPVEVIDPHPGFTYLSFSTERKVAEHFADVNGFGSDYLDVSKQLGSYGYVISYTPAMSEVLFHHDLFSYLPYQEAFSLQRMGGIGKVEFLKAQKEVVILQPAAPFKDISKM